MSSDLLLKYDGNFPRYTSYPTAPHFSENFSYKTYQSWLKDLPPKQSLSLYFHIPFCDELCWYCGCFTTITKRYQPISNYLEILLQEIELIADLLKEKNHKVSHIHFGGGSPTIISSSDFQNLMQKIADSFSFAKNAEIAIEIDPRNINEEKIKTYAESGINRASIGVQDFNLEVQKAINRQQSFEVVKNCVDLLRKYQINNINFDLIYGLPKQTIEDVRKNIESSLLLNPSRIALFAYAHVKWKKKQMRLINESDLPDAKSRILMYDLAAKNLLEAGFTSIGLDHFAAIDDSMSEFLNSKKLKRNFQGYSSDQGNFIIGFGVSAIGYLEHGYVQNSVDFNEYKEAVLAKELPIKKGLKLSKNDQIRKRIIDDLMCYFSSNLGKVISDFNLSQNYFDPELLRLKDLQKDGFVVLEDGILKVNKKFPQIIRVVCAAFDEYFGHGENRHSKI